MVPFSFFKICSRAACGKLTTAGDAMSKSQMLRTGSPSATICPRMDNFAIIATGGKQYPVTVGQKLRIEKLTGEAGETVTFDEVLFQGGSATKIGTPLVAGAKVTATILRQARSKKVRVYKYHSKNRFDKTKGHRQHFTEVKIESL